MRGKWCFVVVIYYIVNNKLWMMAEVATPSPTTEVSIVAVERGKRGPSNVQKCQVTTRMARK